MSRYLVKTACLNCALHKNNNVDGTLFVWNTLWSCVWKKKKGEPKKKDSKSKLLHLASHLLNWGKPQHAGLHSTFVFTNTNEFHDIYTYFNIQGAAKVISHSIFKMSVFSSDLRATL